MAETESRFVSGIVISFFIFSLVDWLLLPPYFAHLERLDAGSHGLGFLSVLILLYQVIRQILFIAITLFSLTVVVFSTKKALVGGLYQIINLINFMYAFLVLMNMM